MKAIKYILGCFAAGMLATGFQSCVDLDPNPMSFNTPENTFVDKSGIETMLRVCRKQLHFEWFGNAFNSANCESFAVYEYAWSDLAVMGGPEVKEIHNMVTQLTPTTNRNLHLRYWEWGWNGIKYANTVITRTPMAQGMNSDEERNSCLAEGYFHRAYWYYLLVHQFGDVPWIGEEITGAKLDFNTVSRRTILANIKKDMEFAVQWLPLTCHRGAVNRAAGEHLLAKICLATSDFQGAVDAASRCINDYGLHLMTNRFGVNASNAAKDVYNDLFQEDNISAADNAEAILVVQERYGIQGASSGAGSSRKRTFSPQWHSGSKVKTPDGKNGTTDAKGVYDGYEQLEFLGRGLAKIRPTNYAQFAIWDNCGDDMRHNDNNWFDRSRIYYNLPPSEGGSAKYFGKPVDPKFCTDTMRCYFSFPIVKVLVSKDDPKAGGNVPEGGFTDQYVFRLAETYLNRAEAYWWMGKIKEATDDVNALRRRVNAPELKSVTLDDILDERARELFFEEHRKSELTRVAVIKAERGDNGYSMDNFSERNWYYDRIMEKNNFFAEEYYYSTNAFVMKPYHVWWPIPLNAIESNTQGRINQNIGYDGAEDNIPVEELEKRQ